MGKGIGWGHLGNYKNYRVVGAKKEEETPLSLEERQQQLFNKFNKSWEYDPEKLKPAFGWLGAPLQTGSTPSVSVTPTPTPSVTPTMTPTPSATPIPVFSPSGITGLQLWFDADDTSTLSLSGNLVESWTSKGSTPLVLTATTTTRRPQYITTGGTGSSNAVLFLSSSTAANRSLLTQQDSSQSFNLISGYTIFKVQKNTGNKSASGTIGDCPFYLYKFGTIGAFTNQQILLRQYSSLQDTIQTGATAGYSITYGSPGNFTPDTFAISNYFLNGYSIDYTDMGPTKVYGEDIISGNSANLTSTYPMTTSYSGKTLNGMGIGGTNYGGTPSAVISTNSEVYEFLVYNRKLTTNEFSQVMNYLRTKWDYVVDLSTSAVFDVNYTGKTTNTNDYYTLVRGGNVIGNSFWGGQNMKYVLSGGTNGEFISNFLTSNLGINVNLTDSNGYVVDSATCRKTNSPNITYSAGTYNLTMDMDYNCIDPSPTPTETITPTPTITETYTPTPTPTITETITPTPTYTPSYTPTMTPTMTPSPTTPSTASVTFVAGAQDLANNTTYTFSSLNTGVGLVVVAISCSATSQRALSSVTIGGVSATINHSLSVGGGSSGGNPIMYGMAYAVVTGSTNSVVVTWNGQALNTNVAYWRINDYNSTTPVYNGQTSNNTSSTGLSLTTSSLSGTSVGIAASALGAANTTQTWTNATEVYDGTIESGVPSTSGANFTTSSSGTRQVSTSHASNSYGEILIMSVWN